LKDAIRDIAGAFVQFFVKERFDNLNKIDKVKCPTLYIHGKQDKLIP